jgi:hypothetical protein
VSRVIDDFIEGRRKNGSELLDEDVGRILTLYSYDGSPNEQPVVEAHVGLRVWHYGILQLELRDQRDLRKGLIPEDRILTGYYCDGCASQGNDPECGCGGVGWGVDGFHTPSCTGTVAEITRQARGWAEYGI